VQSFTGFRPLRCCVIIAATWIFRYIAETDILSLVDHHRVSLLRMLACTRIRGILVGASGSVWIMTALLCAVSILGSFGRGPIGQVGAEHEAPRWCRLPHLFLTRGPAILTITQLVRGERTRIPWSIWPP